MRGVVQISALAAMVLVPVGVGTLLATSPDQIRFIPVAFWLVWLVASLIVSLEAPRLVAWFSRSNHRMHGAIRYARWILVLGLMNLACSAAVLFFLGRAHTW